MLIYGSARSPFRARVLFFIAHSYNSLATRTSDTLKWIRIDVDKIVPQTNE